jgi:hypothetical protein
MASLEDIYPTTMQYQPHRDNDWSVIEPASDYVMRMQKTLLSHWPAEVLLEWLHRHADFMEDYAAIGFEALRYDKVEWQLDQVPGREAFRDETFCDNFHNIEARAADNPHDWLAHYMPKEGTWNTPIILLENPSDIKGMKSPYHLLEGRRRLSFLQGLMGAGKGAPCVFTLDSPSQLNGRLLRLCSATKLLVPLHDVSQ